ncbi:hypothetical protein BC937DRAFT_90346 [Endogone sp. FLAS-F59071]|nr:hypothetical protein BC937DRAFT_90346 [Endogone sp. FLAS-F59071]RUS23228.1 hypothetical protein BC937DRAFT_90346 [Endogone sp. FLAS-F59071]|eukprot:RUS23227.1 hypothetical protein BC937DRAFT_90346 [Endogone sp. FLAS-F59071]
MASQEELIIRKAITKDQIQQCYDIRIEVFVHEQNCSLESEIDEYDPVSHHWLALLPGNPELVVGTIRLYIKPGTNVGKIGRVTVKATLRGLRIGARLMAECERYARESLEVVEFVLNAQQDKAKFYEKLGYVVDEGIAVFCEEGIPHVRMTKAA